MVMVDEPAPDAIGDGLKATVTPEGWPDADRETAELKPPVTNDVIFEVPLEPCVTLSDDGDAERLKDGLLGEPPSALIRPTPLGLPQPVTRS